MATEEKTKELVAALTDSVINMDEDKAREIAQLCVKEGVDAYQAVNQGLAVGMDKVGELYSKNEYFVPELLLCSDALYAALDILKPHINNETLVSKKRIILGTVEGDVHDIGKNLVKIMFEAAGWEVMDLGADVKVSRFAEEHKAFKADVIGLSALMTTSMLAMPKVIELIRAQDKEVRIIVGGAPLSRDIAESYGANGFASNASEAVLEAIRVLGCLK